MKTQTGRKCVIYARYSSDKQSPMSCADQVREAREYASRQGWQVVEVFEDAAISGTKGRDLRPGWDALMTYIEDGHLPDGLVLAWAWDRWSRDQFEGPISRMQIQRLGVDVADTEKGIFGRDLVGQILATVTEQSAADFIVKLRRGVKRGLKSRREAGYWTCPPPFGYTTKKTGEGSILVPLAPEAVIVEEIFTRLAAGEVPAAIVRDLNRRVVRTKRGSSWTPSTVRDIGRNPVYIGQVVHYDSRNRGVKQVNVRTIPLEMAEVYDGQHDPIIDEAIFYKVQSRLQVAPRGPNALRVYPLSGRVICGDCGAVCQVTGGAWPYRNYRCRAYGLERQGCSSRRYVRVELLEAAVKKWAAGLVRDTAVIEAAARQIVEEEHRLAKRSAAERGPLERKIQALERKQHNLIAAIADGDAPRPLVASLRQVEEDLERAQDALGGVGEATRPLPLAEVQRRIRAALRAAAVDLLELRDIVTIILPADPDAPPVLSAFGASYELTIPRTPKQRPESI